MVVSSLFGGQPAKKGGKKATTVAAKPKPGKATGSFGEQVRSLLGGGGIDPTNINSHPDYKIEFENPNPAKAGDDRPFWRKVTDELGGRTAAGDEIRYIKKATKLPDTTAPSKGPSTAKHPRKTSAVATPKRTVVKAGKVSSGGPMKSARMESAGYTTSAPSSAHSGFTFGSKSSARPKVAAAKKTKIGASHNVKRTSLFKTRKD